MTDMKNVNIRNEQKNDYRIVEELTRDAFWNLNMPGCNEHFLVHKIRSHEDFIPELDFVAEANGRIVGNIIYTKSKLLDETGMEKEILTFGPISIHPEYQRQGIGKALLNYSFSKALELGYEAIVIFGNPGNYVSSGFKSCKKYNVYIGEEIYPTAMLVKELKQGFFDGRSWRYEESTAYEIDEAEAELFDKEFEYKEKEYRTSQEEFYIYCNSSIRS